MSRFASGPALAVPPSLVDKHYSIIRARQTETGFLCRSLTYSLLCKSEPEQEKRKSKRQKKELHSNTTSEEEGASAMFPCSSETSQIATRKGLAPKPPNEDAVGGNGRRKRSAQEESQAEVQDDGHRSSSSSNSNNNSNNNSNSNSSNSNSSSSKSSKSSNSLPRRSITLRQAHAALMRKEHQIKPEALLARLQAGGVFLVRLQKRGGVGRGGEFR